MELDGRISLSRIASDSEGLIDPDAIRQAITPKTRLIAMTHASNVIGSIQPIAEVGRIAREHDLLLLVDAAQSAGLVPIDVRTACIDLLAFPGHKALFGPTGTGALYVGPRARLRAWREGGTGGDSSSEIQPADFPYFLEGGTPNVLGAAGLAAGIRHVLEHGLEKTRAHEVALLQRLRERLADLPGLTFFGPRNPAHRVGALSLRCTSLPPAEIGGILDQTFDIAVRPGLHCAPYIHRALGTFPEGTLRVSPGPFNTPDDIDQLADALTEILA
jgi:selenocysteine lyase/cysteine desulfurase